MTNPTRMAETDQVTLTLRDVELLAEHLRFIYTDKAPSTSRMAVHDRMDIAVIEIAPTAMSTPGVVSDVWDSVTINGHSCGNRHGGAVAYARMVAGDPHWWRAGI